MTDTKKDKKKIIFFLGNGFSQGFGSPSMNMLYDICLEPNHEYYQNLLIEAKNIYPLSFFIANGIRDVELLLTVWKAYYESHETYVSNSNAYKSGRGHFEDYIENMCGWLHSFTAKSTKLKIFSEFKEWLKDIVTKYEIVFITTNYDLLLEKAFLDNSIDYHYIETGITNSIPIRKLHGSISWFSSSHTILRTHDSFRYNDFFKGKEKNSYVYDFGSDCLSFPTLAGTHMQFGSQLREDNVIPIFTIIPPLIGKKYNELFSRIALSIYQDFKDFDYLFIVGYSFPDADPVVKDIIISAYDQYKSRECKIICINDNETVCDKINKLFENKLEIIKEKWSLDNFRHILGTT